MTILVIGGTGRVGSHLVRALATRGARVRVLTRSAAKAESLPAGVEGFLGDLQDPLTIRSVFQGIERAFLLTANSPSEALEGLMAVSGAVDARVERVVFVSAEAARLAPLVPHFGIKNAIEAALAKSGLAHTILYPSNFYQNDDLVRDAIFGASIYPTPFGSLQCARVDARDVADAAANVLTADGLGGEAGNGSYVLSGPAAYNGEECAALWSLALERPVAYGGDDLESWETQAVRASVPAWFAYDLKLMYRYLHAKGLAVRPQDLEPQEAILGHPPRTYEAFAGERVAEWTGDGSTELRSG